MMASTLVGLCVAFVPPRLGRRSAILTGVSLGAPAHAAAPCLDGALKWKQYRECEAAGGGDECVQPDPNVCIEKPYNEQPSFKQASAQQLDSAAEKMARIEAEAELTRQALGAYRSSKRARAELPSMSATGSPLLLAQLTRSAIGTTIAYRVASKGYARGSLSRDGAIAAFAVATLAFTSSVRSGVTLLTFYWTGSKLTKLGAKVRRFL